MIWGRQPSAKTTPSNQQPASNVTSTTTTSAPRTSSGHGPCKSTRKWTCRTPPGSSTRRSPRAAQPARSHTTCAVAAAGLGSESEIVYGGTAAGSPCRKRARRLDGTRRDLGPTPTASTPPPCTGAIRT